ncbi:glycosyltransferase family 39 protein [Altererythrobacter sp. ZODW24]|uniref:ArnT family glycosyltransferase n=1 Tax=Altererythrobacter sp. ZODW24 TaxID=2185142 RepID=UPI000DF79991|nr:glycosyltransferase family 39 protein [Altererythrobacter sp. ZODW24]
MTSMAASGQRQVHDDAQEPRHFVWIRGAICAVLAMHLWLAFTRAINWDEFYYYAQIEQFMRGELRAPLQTIHVRLFGWLAALPGTGVDKIIAGRLVMLACECVSATAIFIIARRFVARNSALLASLAYLSAGFVVENGFSFRTDPLAIALLMAALCILLRSRLDWWRILIFGVLVGLAGMVTMKSILILPAFAGVAWLRWNEAERSLAMLARIAASVAAAGAFFGLILLAHMAAMPEQVTQAAQAQQAQAMVSSSGSKMFFLGKPQFLGFFGMFGLTALPLYIALFVTPLIIYRSQHSGAEKWALAGLFLPLSTLFFYHNTLPYYYAFMLPPVVAAAALALDAGTRKYGTLLVTAPLVANALVITALSGPSHIDKQRQIQQAAATIFPEPVQYFDFPAMLPEFKKANVFMTLWGIEGYLRGEGPSYEQILARKPVPLLLADDPQFNPSFLHLLQEDENSPLFRPRDREVLLTTYRQFWGPFWIAGTEVEAGTNSAWEVHVPGPYTVMGTGLSVNGQAYPKGAVVELKRGSVTLSNAAEAPARLTWGDNLKPPEAAPPERPYWTDF